MIGLFNEVVRFLSANIKTCSLNYYLIGFPFDVVYEVKISANWDEVEHQMSLQVLPAIYTNERNPRRTVCAVKARERLDTEPYKNTPIDISKIK